MLIYIWSDKSRRQLFYYYYSLHKTTSSFNYDENDNTKCRDFVGNRQKKPKPPKPPQHQIIINSLPPSTIKINTRNVIYVCFLAEKQALSL